MQLLLLGLWWPLAAEGVVTLSFIGGTLILDNDRRTLGSIVVGYLIVLGTQGHLDTLGCLIVSGIEGHFDRCIGCLIVSGYNDTLC